MFGGLRTTGRGFGGPNRADEDDGSFPSPAGRPETGGGTAEDVGSSGAGLRLSRRGAGGSAGGGAGGDDDDPPEGGPPGRSVLLAGRQDARTAAALGGRGRRSHGGGGCCGIFSYLRFGFAKKLLKKASHNDPDLIEESDLPPIDRTAEDPADLGDTLFDRVTADDRKHALCRGMLHLIKFPLLLIAFFDALSFGCSTAAMIIATTNVDPALAALKSLAAEYNNNGGGFGAIMKSGLFHHALVLILFGVVGLNALKIIFARHSDFLYSRCCVRLEAGVNGLLIKTRLAVGRGGQGEGAGGAGAPHGRRSTVNAHPHDHDQEQHAHPGQFRVELPAKNSKKTKNDGDNVDVRYYFGFTELESVIRIMKVPCLDGLSLFVKLPVNFFLLKAKLAQNFNAGGAAKDGAEQPNFIPFMLLTGGGYALLITLIVALHTMCRKRFAAAQNTRFNLTAAAFANLRALKMYGGSDGKFLYHRIFPAMKEEFRLRQIAELVRRALFVSDEFRYAAVLLMIALYGEQG